MRLNQIYPSNESEPGTSNGWFDLKAMFGPDSRSIGNVNGGSSSSSSNNNNKKSSRAPTDA